MSRSSYRFKFSYKVLLILFSAFFLVSDFIFTLNAMFSLSIEIKGLSFWYILNIALALFTLITIIFTSLNFTKFKLDLTSSSKTDGEDDEDQNNSDLSRYSTIYKLNKVVLIILTVIFMLSSLTYFMYLLYNTTFTSLLILIGIVAVIYENRQIRIKLNALEGIYDSSKVTRNDRTVYLTVVSFLIIKAFLLYFNIYNVTTISYMFLDNEIFIPLDYFYYIGDPYLLLMGFGYPLIVSAIINIAETMSIGNKKVVEGTDTKDVKPVYVKLFRFLGVIAFLSCFLYLMKLVIRNHFRLFPLYKEYFDYGLFARSYGILFFDLFEMVLSGVILILTFFYFTYFYKNRELLKVENSYKQKLTIFSKVMFYITLVLSGLVIFNSMFYTSCSTFIIFLISYLSLNNSKKEVKNAFISIVAIMSFCFVSNMIFDIATSERGMDIQEQLTQGLWYMALIPVGHYAISLIELKRFKNELPKPELKLSETHELAQI